MGRILCVALLSLGFSISASAQKRVALVIGNNAYVGLQHLNNPVNDAQLVGDVLRSNLGFEVIQRTDLDRRSMFDALHQAAAMASAADVFVVYYSGHGVQGPGGNFLVPTDANIGAYEHIRRDAVPVNDIVDAMQSTGARVALLVLDACRDFAYGNKGSSKGLTRPDNISGNLLVAYATQDGATAADGTGRNSPYAKALAQQLQRDTVPLLEVLDEVAEMVKRETANRQRPTRYGDMKVKTCLLPEKCAVGLAPAPIGVSERPPVPDVDLADSDYWHKVKDQTELHHFLQYQLKYHKGMFLDAARKKAGTAVRGRSGCALREANLPMDIEFDWQGSCRDGLADGRGTKTYFRGDVKQIEWIGVYDRGIPTGKWSGTWLDASPSGRKTITISFRAGGDISPAQEQTYKNGAIYDGETDATLSSQIGIPNGKGKMQFTDGGVYEGDWIKGQRTGQGVLIYQKNTSTDAPAKYTGEFKDGVPSGVGTMLRNSGASYTGTWANGRRNGRGKNGYADGGTYDGDFVDDRRTGRGVMIFPANPGSEAFRSYEGEMKDDLFHGYGTMTQNSGATYVGMWANNKRHGRGRYVAPNGEIYDGEWVDNQRSGYGSWSLPKTGNATSLIRYVGDFRDNLPNGRGTLTWGNGAEYVGEIKNNKPHGRGELRRPDGTIAKGQFVETRSVAEGPL